MPQRSAAVLDWTVDPFLGVLQTNMARPVPVDVWNVHEMDLDIVSRTNNPLERFNRELNGAMPSAHSSQPAFVSTIDGATYDY
ncbi:hypothetical protein F444_20515 [Phytophthora nicotianae P1976]|uniref:Transposase n=1 Tax=Phytophthora nicotianae P1976 TaxID=1317066 RepID=A0A080Z4B7_PHYNI|nr:hypothetical protein F444_20515 [Phytophthora nicotianae P1976]